LPGLLSFGGNPIVDVRVLHKLRMPCLESVLSLTPLYSYQT
jgi:hypothetical protein